MRPNYVPPYFMILVIINLITLFFSTYFVSILLIGVVFKIFLESLKNEYYYILAMVIVTFMIIETTHGFKLFSLTIISFIIYYFILGRIKHLFSSDLIAEFMYVLVFYFLLFLFGYFYSHFTTDIVAVFIVNFLLDSIIVGFFL